MIANVQNIQVAHSAMGEISNSYEPGSFSTPCIGDGKPPTFNRESL